MRIRPRVDNGSIMLGMAALIFILGMVCGTILLRSLDTYRATALGEKRLQARAAAEGAVVLLLQAPEQERKAVRIGPCRVTFSSPSRREAELVVPFTVDVVGDAEPVDQRIQRRAPRDVAFALVQPVLGY